MRKGEPLAQDGKGRRAGWCRPAQKLLKGSLPYGDHWPNGQTDPTPKRVVIRSEGKGSGPKRQAPKAVGPVWRTKGQQPWHGRYKKMCSKRGARAPPARVPHVPPWGDDNHRWGRRGDGATLDAMEATVINGEGSRPA